MPENCEILGLRSHSHKPACLVHVPKVVRHRPISEKAVLDDWWYVIFSIGPGQRHVDLGVVQEDHPHKAVIDLGGVLSVNMAVIPQRRCRVIHRKLGRPCLAGAERKLRTAIKVTGKVHAAPVRGDRHVGAILH